jgi:hypothetical protein
MSVVGCYRSKGGLDSKDRRLLQVDSKEQQGVGGILEAQRTTTGVLGKEARLQQC